MKIKIFTLIFLSILMVDSGYATSTIWSWAKDMYNQVSLKPQEEGSINRFPVGSVTTEGIEISSNGIKHIRENDLSWFQTRNNLELAPVNPVKATDESIQNGEYLYNVYCASCHGENGNAGTVVGNLRGVPPIAPILSADPTITEGYLYLRITYGGVSPIGMPPLGYATLPKERWDIVNYVKNQWGGN